jgi:predicted ArsR family transcriptional regulator
MDAGEKGHAGSTMTRLLRLLQAGGTRRLDDLANNLETTPQMVEAMLEELSRLGYLRQVGSGCSERCDACPMAGKCQVASGGRVWTLTERGLQASP